MLILMPSRTSPFYTSFLCFQRSPHIPPCLSSTNAYERPLCLPLIHFIGRNLAMSFYGMATFAPLWTLVCHTGPFHESPCSSGALCTRVAKNQTSSLPLLIPRTQVSDPQYRLSIRLFLYNGRVCSQEVALLHLALRQRENIVYQVASRRYRPGNTDASSSKQVL
jgi:hypothetical protein